MHMNQSMKHLQTADESEDKALLQKLQLKTKAVQQGIRTEQATCQDAEEATEECTRSTEHLKPSRATWRYENLT
jgi:hypothetical protein